MSDTNRVRFSYGVESVYGTFPNISLQDMRVTSGNLKQNTQLVFSNEIRSDRQNVDAVRIAIDAGGDLGIEMPIGVHDDLFRAALFSAAWSSAVTLGPLTTIAAVNASAGVSRFTDSALGMNFAVGQWIRTTGFATAANNGLFKVTAGTSGFVDCVGFTSSVTEAAGPSVTIKQGEQIVNGVTPTTFGIEKHFADLSSEYERFLGQLPAQLELNVQVEQINSGRITWVGKQGVSASASGGSGYTAANSNPVTQPVDNILGLMEGGTGGAPVAFTRFRMALNNNSRFRRQVGTAGPISIGAGSCDVQLDLDAYYTDKTMFDKYLNGTASSLAIGISDNDGKKMVIDLPRLRFSDGSRGVGGKNQDVMRSLSAMSFRHSTEDVTIRMTRWLT